MLNLKKKIVLIVRYYIEELIHLCIEQAPSQGNAVK